MRLVNLFFFFFQFLQTLSFSNTLTWFDSVRLFFFFLQRLYALGGEVADSVQKVTHLIASKVTRTVKFLTAMSVVKHIVNPDWLEESWRSQTFVGM